MKKLTIEDASYSDTEVLALFKNENGVEVASIVAESTRHGIIVQVWQHADDAYPVGTVTVPVAS